METIQTRRIYPVLGFLSIITLIYINVGDKFRLPILLQPHMSFVAVNGTHFISADDDIPIYINGWNSYWLMEESIWSASRTRVSKMLRTGSEMGMTVCRTWGFNDGGHNALQISPGVFDEKVFQALDFVIVEARKYKVRLILSLVNNLNAFGGKAQYVRWAQSAGHNVTSADSFFSHPAIKGYYKNYIKSVLTRKNSLSGVKYSEEPAIFAWELINEPRCTSNSSASILQSWISEMAYYIKSLDPKHLVTVGLEGFYGPKRIDKTGVNPGEWAATLGSDFIDNSAIQHIDFASVHAYPDNWIPSATVEDKIKHLSLWIDSHVSDAEYLLKKPVLFSEVGSSLGQNEQGRIDKRVLVLRTVYDKIYTSAKKRQAGAGALIWQLIVEEVEHYGDEFSLVVWEHPSVYKTIVEQSCRLRYLEENETANRKIHAASNCSHMIP